MILGARTGAWAKSGKALPYLRRVAYLESHGTEWINTNVYSRDAEIIDMKFSVVQSIGNAAIVGQRHSSNDRFSFWVQSGAGGVNGKWGSVRGFNVGTIYEIKLDKTATTYTVNGSSVNLTYSAPTYEDALIYFINLYGRPPVKAKLKFYNCKFIKDDLCTHDFIPVIDVSGRPCLYNQEQTSIPADDPSRFFYNQGTGEFTWGELSE